MDQVPAEPVTHAGPARAFVATVALAGLLLLGACRQSATRERAFGNDRDKNLEAPVASIAGKGLAKAELSDFWFGRYRDQYRRTLDELIDDRVARTDAARIGLTVPAAVVDEALEKEVAARRDLQKDVYGSGDGLEAWVRMGYGIDVETWKRTILRPRFEGLLLRWRVARIDARSRLRIHARVIVVSTGEKAARIHEKLRGGADFSLTALNQSEDATKRVGGALPPIARGDLAHFPIVEDRLFAAAVRQIVGPLRVQVGGKPQWQIYKVVRRDEPWNLKGGALFAALEKDLAENPMTRAEYDVWRDRIRRRHEVRYFDPEGQVWNPGPRPR